MKAVVVASSDKCYQNNESGRAFIETDALGGNDLYSASKASAEIVTAAYRNSFFHSKAETGALIATVRAGNVIGGGDWAYDRLIPDLVRARADESNVLIRHPHAVRPWQHVLEPLAGYLLVAEQLLAGVDKAARAFNFGPLLHEEKSVQMLVSAITAYWSGLPRVHYDDSPKLREAQTLRINSTVAMSLLDWSPRWSFEDTVARTALWYTAVERSRSPENVRISMSHDLDAYIGAK